MTACLKCGDDTPLELCATCNTTETIRTELQPHLEPSIAAELADKLADLLREYE